MASQDNRSVYAERLHRVLEYIDRNLDRPLDLDTLAGVAHFSAYHFHRVFRAWAGETLGDYLRRRRVELAAIRLAAQPRVSVLSVALSVGFSSTEAFARAFRARFGCTATAWRRQHSNPGQAIGKAGQALEHRVIQHEASPQLQSENLMEVTVIERPPAKVAYLRHVGPYGESISRFWQEVVYPWMVANSLLGQPRYGISHDDPTVTSPDQCRYDAGVEIKGPLAAPGKALTTVIPGGSYAVGRFQGGVAAIDKAWDHMLRIWLPDSGLQLDARPLFEYYPQDSTYDPVTGCFTCDIAVPVASLQ